MLAAFNAPIRRNVASSPVISPLQTPRQLEAFTEDFAHTLFIRIGKLMTDSIRQHATDPFEYLRTINQFLLQWSSPGTQDPFAVDVVGEFPNEFHDEDILSSLNRSNQPNVWLPRFPPIPPFGPSIHDT